MFIPKYKELIEEFYTPFTLRSAKDFVVDHLATLTTQSLHGDRLVQKEHIGAKLNRDLPSQRHL